MENENVVDSSINDLTVNEQAKESLNETGKWGVFFSVLGFIVVAFMIIGGVVLAFTLSDMPQASDSAMVVSLVYVVFALIYIIPLIYLVRFSTMVQAAVNGGSSDRLARAFQSQRILYRISGILTILFIAGYIVAMIVAVNRGTSLFRDIF